MPGCHATTARLVSLDLLPKADQVEQEQRGPSDANVILLQYQLHKLFVFSIYYSARGVDLRAGGSLEVEELLSTARGALQLQRKGLGVWSNWDLVVRLSKRLNTHVQLITHAALILLDSVHTGEIERNGKSPKSHPLTSRPITGARSHQRSPYDTSACSQSALVPSRSIGRSTRECLCLPSSLES